MPRFSRIAGLIVIVATLTGASRSAPADEPSSSSDPAPPTDDNAPPASAAPATRALAFALAARLGTMTSHGSNDTTYLAPDLGLGLEAFVHRNFGASLRYDGSVSKHGTSSVSVRRLEQQLVVTIDARVRVHRAASLRGGLGGGGALMLATTSFGDETRTATSFEPGLAWLSSFDVDIPDTAFGASIGTSGLWHRASHDMIYFAGLSYSFR